MEIYKIKKDDIKSRVYFITGLVQNQKNATMQGALTSKSDFMGGIFDRFINSLTESLIFNKVIFQKPEFITLSKDIKIVEDFYYYNPSKNMAGIAPDVFGVSVDDKIIPFTKFDNKWEPVDGMPQIEVKTFKAKDQMISLRNQNYDGQYLILVDLELRIDYLVPFLDKNILNDSVLNNMLMDDSAFIIKDDKGLVKGIKKIDFSSDEIGNLRLIAITNATDFMSQATLCEANISVWRVKEIIERRANVKKGLLHDKLSQYANNSPRIDCLYEFNDLWKSKMKINETIKCLDFSSDKIDQIEICKYNVNGVVITALEEGCSFNGQKLACGKQYSVQFAVLDRSGNGGSEYFMQKQCAQYLKGVEKELVDQLVEIIGK